MESGYREQGPRVVRLRPPGITPVEIWDLVVDGGILWDFMDEPSFHRVLGRALLTVRDGRAVSRSTGALPPVCQDFDGVYVAGGRALEPGLEDAFRDHLPFSVVISRDGAYCGERGGFHLLAERGHAEDSMVVDVGQTAVKVSIAGRRTAYPRDWQRLPLRDDAPEIDSVLARNELRTFIGGCIRNAAGRWGVRPRAIVLALPCELGDDIVAGGSSYAGMMDDESLASDSILAAGLRDIEVLVLNDAELAALSAACDRSAALPGRILVITLGFGVGAALLETSP